MFSPKSIFQLLFLSSFIILFSQCDRLDTTAPVIKLVGDETVRVHLGDTYLEQGAIAVDDIDGDITDDIFIDNGDILIDEIGTYEVRYRAVDDIGNSTQITRLVNVYGEAADYAGSYNANSICESISSDYIVDIIAGIDNNIIFSNFLNDGMDVTALVTGDLGDTFFVEDSNINTTGMLVDGTGTLSNFEFDFSTSNSIDSTSCSISLIP